MNLDQDELAARGRTHLSIDDFDTARMDPVTGGGSGRIFYRLHYSPQGRSLIVMHYDLDRPDNRRFVPVTCFLRDELNVAVPELYQFDEERRLVWLQDLGETDLWSQRLQGWPRVQTLYQQTLDEVWKIHAVGQAAIPCGLEPPFNEQLYRWEQAYFYEHFLLPSSKRPDAQLKAVFEQPAWHELAHELASLPRFLVHRDFQSRNIMIHESHVYLIDYQGLRWGRPEYDLASLLLDPYVDLGEEERLALLRHYHGAHRQDEWETFLDLYRKCAAQRLMQALGAYGNLGHRLGKKEFLDYIPVALPRLRQVLADGGLLPDLQEILEDRQLKIA